MKLQNHDLVAQLIGYKTTSTDQLSRRIRRAAYDLIFEITESEELTESSRRVAIVVLNGAVRLCTVTTPVEDQKQYLSDALDILVSAAPQFSWRRDKIIKDNGGSIIAERSPIMAESVSPLGHGGQCTCETMPQVTCGAVLHNWI